MGMGVRPYFPKAADGSHDLVHSKASFCPSSLSEQASAVFRPRHYELISAASKPDAGAQDLMLFSWQQAPQALSHGWTRTSEIRHSDAWKLGLCSSALSLVKQAENLDVTQGTPRKRNSSKEDQTPSYGENKCCQIFLGRQRLPPSFSTRCSRLCFWWISCHPCSSSRNGEWEPQSQKVPLAMRHPWIRQTALARRASEEADSQWMASRCCSSCGCVGPIQRVVSRSAMVRLEVLKRRRLQVCRMPQPSLHQQLKPLAYRSRALGVYGTVRKSSTMRHPWTWQT